MSGGPRVVSAAAGHYLPDTRQGRPAMRGAEKHPLNLTQIMLA